MIKTKFKFLVIFVILLCPHSFSLADDPLKVIVSIVPQKYFVEKIGKRLVDVSVMVLPGANPATYEPKPHQMVKVTKAKIFFAIGVPFEKIWLEKFIGINPIMQVVHTEVGIKKIQMAESFYCDEEDYHEVDHHGVNDPHIWLSPTLVKVQARNILDALAKADPGNQEKYAANYNEFIKELNGLDHHIREILLERGEGYGFMVYHPSWGYFAESYGLKQIPIETEGKEPKARKLRIIIEHARKENVKAIFVQPQFSAKSGNIIANAIGCQVLVADPLAENWAENLLKVARSLRSSQ